MQAISSFSQHQVWIAPGLRGLGFRAWHPQTRNSEKAGFRGLGVWGEFKSPDFGEISAAFREKAVLPQTVTVEGFLCAE